MTKTILITDASSGFGRDTAETLAAAGHKVFVGIRDIAQRNRAVADALCAKGIESVALDVTNDASVDAAIAALLAKSEGQGHREDDARGVRTSVASTRWQARPLRHVHRHRAHPGRAMRLN